MNQKKKDCTLLGFDDRLFRLIGMPVVAMVIPLLFFRDIIHDAESYWGKVPIAFIHTVVTWQGVRAIFIHLSRKFPDWKDWKKRMKWIIGSVILYTGSVCTMVTFAAGVFSIPLDPSLVPSPISAYGSSYLMVLALGAVYESIRFFQLWKTTAMEKERLERAHLASQLEGLRNQVNPHFLFNSLNTLTYLIPEAPEKAVGLCNNSAKYTATCWKAGKTRSFPCKRNWIF